MPLQKRLLKFQCSKCRNYEFVDLLKNTIADKDDIISSKNEVIALLQEKLKKYEAGNKSTGVSYAGAVMSQHQRSEGEVQNSPEVIVKPKVEQNADRTREDVSRGVNPVALKIGVKNVRAAKNGVLVLKCPTKDDTERLAEAVRDSLGNSYDVKVSTLKKPRVKIPGFDQQLSAIEIEESIKCQNQLSGDVKVVHTRKKHSGQNTLFCECSPELYAGLMAMKRVYIGWKRYPVYEDLSIPRCYQCQGYYHKKDACKSGIVCIQCGGGHKAADCLDRENKCCRNCKMANTRYGRTYNTEHEATDVNCPVYKYHLQVLKNRTEYLY